jgi:endonuclease YncB( thermonuclease family)
MNERIRTFIRRRGPGLLILLIILLGFIAFMFTRGGLEISGPVLTEQDRRAAGTVTEVYDGDTFKVALKEADKSVVVRIRGIDCPESKRNEKCQEDAEDWMGCEEQIPLGKRATRKARSMVAGDTVILESGEDGGFETDPYDRILAYVRMADGRDYGLTMVKNRQCRDFSDDFEHPRMDRYKQHETSVKPLQESPSDN